MAASLARAARNVPADLVQRVLAVAEGVDDVRIELLAGLSATISCRAARQLRASR